MTHDQTVASLFNAASALLNDGFTKIRNEDPRLYVRLSEAVTRGAILTLRMDFDKTGVLSTSCTAALGAELAKVWDLEAKRPTFN